MPPYSANASPPPPPPPPLDAAAPSAASPMTIGDDNTMSDKWCGPDGTVNKCEPSLLLTAVWRVSGQQVHERWRRRALTGDKGLECGLVGCTFVAKRDHIDRHVVLLEPLAELDELFCVVDGERRADKRNNTLSLVCSEISV